MPVTCPACGFLSQDPEFCDRCNADLAPPPEARPPRACPLNGVDVVLSDDQRYRLAQPDGKILLRVGPGWRRVRWLPNVQFPKALAALRSRVQVASPVLPPGELIEQAEGVWAVFAATGDWIVPWTAPRGEPLQDLERLLDYLRPLAELLEELHRHRLVWLSFDPTEIERDGEGGWRIANLDLCVFPFRQCSDQARAKAKFAAPEIARHVPQAIGPRTDVYHLALTAWYWLARLLPDGFAGAGLDAFQHEMPPLRVYAPSVPEGIETVLRQGLAIEPSHRFTSPTGFVHAFAEAVERARRRREGSGNLRWEIGQHTRAGITKAALQRGNEDQVLVRQHRDPERALVAVADGISTCDVGTGQLASLITTIVFENTVDSETRAEQFPEKVIDFCRRGTQTLLDWALEKGYRKQLSQGRDLMGTTLTAGWLEGRELILANLGDSRAYLVDGPLVEQLTVDGDLGSYLLAQGSPPEQLRELGLAAKALRECIGGCTVTSQGKVEVLDDSCIPSVSRWPLRAGDVVVLCSDGLVEEGAFLDQETLGDLVRTNSQCTAQELAEVLADAADSLQRLPSLLEPDGFGDNISCIVIKIQDAD